MKITIYGVKHIKGEVEGNSFDFVKIFSMARMEKKSTQTGGAGIDMRGFPELAPSLMKIDFWQNGQGLICEVEKESISKGGGVVVDMVVSVVPINKLK